MKIINAFQTTIKWGIIGIASKHGFDMSEYPNIKEISIGMFYSVIAVLLWEFSIGVYIEKEKNKLKSKKI